MESFSEPLSVEPAITDDELRRRYATMAPTEAEWSRLTEAQRQVVLDTLGPMPDAELLPAEGDFHLWAKQDADDALRGYCGSGGSHPAWTSAARSPCTTPGSGGSPPT